MIVVSDSSPLITLFPTSSPPLPGFAWRNARPFSAPMFQLTAEEVSVPDEAGIRSQNATASKRNIRFRSYVFTEYGAIMAANVSSLPIFTS